MRRKDRPSGAVCFRLYNLHETRSHGIRGRAEPKKSVTALVLCDSLRVVGIACRNFIGCEHALTSGESRNRAELVGNADTHILRCRRRHRRTAASAFALYENATQQFRLCIGRLGQFNFIIAAVGRGMCLWGNETKGCTQSRGSSKGAQTSGEMGEGYHVFL